MIRRIVISVIATGAIVGLAFGFSSSRKPPKVLSEGQCHPGAGLLGPKDQGDALVGLDAQGQMVCGQARDASAVEQPPL